MISVLAKDVKTIQENRSNKSMSQTESSGYVDHSNSSNNGGIKIGKLSRGDRSSGS